MPRIQRVACRLVSAVVVIEYLIHFKQSFPKNSSFRSTVLQQVDLSDNAIVAIDFHIHTTNSTVTTRVSQPSFVQVAIIDRIARYVLPNWYSNMYELTTFAPIAASGTPWPNVCYDLTFLLVVIVDKFQIHLHEDWVEDHGQLPLEETRCTGYTYTSRVPVDGKIIDKAAQSFPHK